jgi:hypothetical protein
LHADLYAPQCLWNVFDKVPSDGSGPATLLSMPRFFSLAVEVGAPQTAQATIRSILREERGGERFREFYDLLHVNNEDWAIELSGRAEAAADRLWLRQGEGYLIHDRSWLHGREAPSGGVTTRRVHRLVFG